MAQGGRVGLTTERLVRAGAELADEIGFEQATPPNSPGGSGSRRRASTRT